MESDKKSSYEQVTRKKRKLTKEKKEKNKSSFMGLTILKPYE
jgi:hypothetical protein